MAKAIGSKKTGGRKAGTPNKKSSRADVKEILEKNNFDPIYEMIDTYKALRSLAAHKIKKSNGYGAGEALNSAGRIANDLAQFVVPKLKAVEHTGPGGKDLLKGMNQLAAVVLGEGINDEEDDD